jgi:formate dehydrogenase iron-sulfur subunit
MAKGMFVDTTLCIGCKACQVACKQWNGLPGEPADFQLDSERRPVAVNFTGRSYDNTARLTATNWRHVKFIEQIGADRTGGRWLMSSDSCKHCSDAGCLNACPTGAIVRTDLGNVLVRQEVCIGCKYCVPACPFGVISFSEQTGTVHKCTLCNDRIHNGLQTACAKACPTGSIAFGEVTDLHKRADTRLAQLKAQGHADANIYGYSEASGLNVFYLFLDRPPVYGVPENPIVPQRRLLLSSGVTIAGALVMGLAALVSFRDRGMRRAAGGDADEVAGEVRDGS